jgi:magnesium chelatase family protein
VLRLPTVAGDREGEVDATVTAVALVGLDARPVRVECATMGGLPAFRLVGLPGTAVKEAVDRVQAAVRRTGLRLNQQRTVINLAPADLPKVGTSFDLPVALAALGASGHLSPGQLAGTWASAELGLDGSVRPVPGTLPMADAARRGGARRFLVAEAAAAEARLVAGLDVVPVADLREAVAILNGRSRPRPVAVPDLPPAEPGPDLAEVRGQAVARRALEIAAAGEHHLLLAGPPGCGKSMLAERLPGLLPPLALADALEVAAVHSVAGERVPDAPLSLRPPFRAPHHTISSAGLVGGGPGIASPGEISLATHGVLFLDELLEVPRWILDALRQPLERGEVTIVRNRATVRYPARVLLVAATNPCPCGYLGDPRRACRCRPDRIERYRSRLSGPLLDRIDLQVELRPLDAERLLAGPVDEPTATVAGRVADAREVVRQRWGPGLTTRTAPILAVRDTCGGAALRRAAQAVETLALTARAFDRALRVARTIADLRGGGPVLPEDVDEAVAYRLPAPVATP